VIARVLIDGPFELVFDYVIPEGLAVVEGCRVRVPIRQKNTSGTVLSVTPPPEQSEFAMREVKSLIDPEPLITPVLLKTARWIANYYGSRRIATAVADPDPEALAKLEKRAAKQHAILTLLLHAPDRTLAVADLGENSAPSLKSLAEKGFITIGEEDVRRDPEADETIVPSEPLTLNDQQKEAFEAIKSSLGALGDLAVQPIL
jgi:primosomal protein N' (replication factor Y)